MSMEQQLGINRKDNMMQVAIGCGAQHALKPLFSCPEEDAAIEESVPVGRRESGIGQCPADALIRHRLLIANQCRSMDRMLNGDAFRSVPTLQCLSLLASDLEEVEQCVRAEKSVASNTGPTIVSGHVVETRVKVRDALLGNAFVYPAGRSMMVR